MGTYVRARAAPPCRKRMHARKAGVLGMQWARASVPPPHWPAALIITLLCGAEVPNGMTSSVWPQRSRKTTQSPGDKTRRSLDLSRPWTLYRVSGVHPILQYSRTELLVANKRRRHTSTTQPSWEQISNSAFMFPSPADFAGHTSCWYYCYYYYFFLLSPGLYVAQMEHSDLCYA